MPQRTSRLRQPAKADASPLALALPTAPLSYQLMSLEPSPNYKHSAGDLLFQDLECVSACPAIETVKLGYRGANVSHVGMYLVVGGLPYIIEAFPPEVRLTPFSVFMRRSVDGQKRPRVFVGRLRSQHQDLIPAAREEAFRLRGLPYDAVYLTGEEAYYCSELIVDCFKVASGDVDFFPEEPMSFRDPKTGKILDYWIQYYAFFGRPVPEGEPGSHPATLSLSDKLAITHRYGDIANWK